MTTAVSILLPETVLIAAAVAIYLAGAFFGTQRSWSWIAGGAILAAGALLGMQRASLVPADLPLILDQMALFGRWLAIALGALLLLLASRPQRSGTAEYVGSLLLTVAGLMIVAGAGDLVLLFVGLELISIPTYVLLYLGRHDAARQEATAKYFFLSVLSSAILLYGFSFLYGLAGSTDLTAVRDALAGATPSAGSLGGLSKLALALVFAGLCFRVTAVPFHFYAPDVYQGTTYPNAALLSVLPKAAGLLVMVRLLTAAAPAAEIHLWQVVLVVSVVTMTFGNLTALWQDDLRRLLAYSSIANAGYMLLGLAVALVAGGPSGTWDGLRAMWFYLAVYALGTIGTFAALEHLGIKGQGPEVRDQGPGSLPAAEGTVDGLAGLGRSRPSVAVLLAICLLSLTGLPPLAGFWGKLLIFDGALNVVPAGGSLANVRAWFIAAAVLGVLNAAVGGAYYLRIVAAMYFRAPLAVPRARGRAGAGLAAMLCAAMVLIIGFYPRPWIAAADTAADQKSFVSALPGNHQEGTNPTLASVK
jgi:NADH-quinone oxidoreductase subunit N